jgi:hypothetical protein
MEGLFMRGWMTTLMGIAILGIGVVAGWFTAVGGPANELHRMYMHSAAAGFAAIFGAMLLAAGIDQWRHE